MSDKASEKREVTREGAELFRQENQIDFFAETSAKTGDNVQMVFLLAAKMLFTKNRHRLSEIASPPINDNQTHVSVGRAVGCIEASPCETTRANFTNLIVLMLIKS